MTLLGIVSIEKLFPFGNVGRKDCNADYGRCISYYRPRRFLWPDRRRCRLEHARHEGQDR